MSDKNPEIFFPAIRGNVCSNQTGPICQPDFKENSQTSKIGPRRSNFLHFQIIGVFDFKKGAAVPSSFSHAEIFDFARPMIEHSHHFKGINQKFLRLPGILKLMFLVFKALKNLGTNKL